MKHSTPSPTKPQQRRFRLIYAIGCLPCRLRGFPYVPCHINHLLRGGVRLGHDYTIGECPWHHVGEPPDEMDAATATGVYGPSRKLQAKAFHEQFGSDDALLAEQNRLIERREAFVL